MDQMQAIFEKVVAIVAEETGAEAKDLLFETRIDDLVTDSLEITELFLVLRDALGPLADSRSMNTIGDIVTWYVVNIP